MGWTLTCERPELSKRSSRQGRTHALVLPVTMDAMCEVSAFSSPAVSVPWNCKLKQTLFSLPLFLVRVPHYSGRNKGVHCRAKAGLELVTLLL